MVSILCFSHPMAYPSEPPPAAPKPEPDTGQLLVVDAIKAAGFGVFADLIERAGLAAELNAAEFLTCFPPVDAAFGEADLERLRAGANEDRVKSLIRYHFVAGNMPEEVLLISRRERSLNNQWLTLWVKNGAIKMNNHAVIVKSDIMAANGIIHGVDKLIRRDVPGAFP
jgi:uncharacterized surface protein with fasciclin (FAS1) repeats